MIIERLFAVGLTALYFFELDQGLLATNAAGEQPDLEMLLAQFLGHALLTALVGWRRVDCWFGSFELFSAGCSPKRRTVLAMGL